ncbi:MAG: acyl-CoA desaturase [Deltaproteobacteria bacterium]|nr:MAG: acyl-CoA desaturase [Deltaproteobacteria bacterium]
MSAATDIDRSPHLTAKSALFILAHFSPLLLIWIGFSWQGVALCIGSYALRMFGVTAGYHRYFSHRSYKAGRVMQFLLAFLAQTSAQKGVLWWASHHRHHHWHSDKPTDVHSPKQHGFWWSHVGWVLSGAWDETDRERVRDLTKYPELVWLDRHHLLPPLLYAAALFAIWGWAGIVWGFLISTVLLWHGTFTINSLSHVFGRRVYDTTDTSRNNWLLAIITLGEGWHNNHHFFQRSTAQGFRWYEFDATYLTLKVMSWLRLVSDVTRPPRHVIEKTIQNMKGHAEGFERSIRERAQAIERSVAARADALEANVALCAEEMEEDLGALGDRTAEMLQEGVDALDQTAPSTARR